MSVPFQVVDAFTAEPFRGNPAAVCWLTESRPDAWLQAVAAEMNLSETAYIRPLGGRFSLRWFTPLVEVDLCGHATLASAHTLWETGRVLLDRSISFETLSGVLTCVRRPDGQISLDFPATPASPCEPPPGLIESLGVKPVSVARSKFDYLVEVTSAAEVLACAPDFTRLRTVPTRGIIVTARADAGSEFHVVSRFFAPAVGIDEDPVCGSAHCCLGPYWSSRLHRTQFVCGQVSRRGARIGVELQGDRAILSGHAVTTSRGELLC